MSFRATYSRRCGRATSLYYRGSGNGLTPILVPVTRRKLARLRRAT